MVRDAFLLSNTSMLLYGSADVENARLVPAR